ncbi:MAG: helix-turn-helix domain-containing protein, partial [Firmicutes bacterium]|nr:helix-turn-helix domain-containing protein [Bacillota bacterium]
MKNIDIAKTLIAKRGEKGITQDELANFIGVSRASVSKWETGQSYPDIIFLPQLAAYFDISLDELMGYVPQMTDENIRKLYVELSNEFAEKPFDDVLNHCHVIIKKYYACFPLLYQLGMLLINYSSAAQDNEKRLSVITEAKGLFIRVKTLCDSIELKQLALRAEAMCEMMLCNSDKVLALLENEKERLFHPSIGVMLSQSYLMLGKTQQAKITLQHSIF